VGLGAVGLYTVDVGIATVVRARTGYGIGGSLDFGSIGSPSTRLVGEVGYLSALADDAVTLDGPVRGRFHDLSLAATVRQTFARRGRIEPYLAVGVGVHAFSSSSGNIDVDVQYNTNAFSVHAGIGAIALVTRDGRNAVRAELTGTSVHRSSRVELRLGYARYLGDRIRAVR
jgi:hypothetical protein